MNSISDPALLPLRDIHLPESLLWWPLAPAWWVLLIVVILLITLSVYLYLRRKHYLVSAAYQSRQELQNLKQTYARNNDDQQLLRDLSELIRRVAISVYPRLDSASLAGDKWLNFWTEAMPEKSFSNGPGRVLASGPYQNSVEFNASEIFDLTESWIENAVQHSDGK